MPSIDKLRASDGSGNASVATVQSTRSGGASTIDVDTVLGINTNFFGTMGTPHTFTDPITSETITVISEATAVDFSGHVDGSNLEIDAIAPGYTDNGSAVGDIIIIRPTTSYANNIADVLDVAHNDDGTIKNDAITTKDQFVDALDPVLRDSETVFDHVASGCVITADAAGSTLKWSMSAGVVYIGGKRVVVSALVAQDVVASKDTYVDVDNAGVVTFTGGNSVANNAASPALAANSVRLGIIVSGASSIAAAASINQGQEDRVLPIASSMPYMVTDSLGNLICPRDPARRILGYRRIAASVGPIGTSATDVDITGVAVPFIAPGNRKVRASLRGSGYSQTGGIGTVYAVMRIREGSTRLGANQAIVPSVANFPEGFNTFVDVTPSAGLHTYKMSVNHNGTGPNFTIGAASDDFTIITVELE